MLDVNFFLRLFELLDTWFSLQLHNKSQHHLLLLPRPQAQRTIEKSLNCRGICTSNYRQVTFSPW